MTDREPPGRHPGFPARPMLRPGVHVCRRSHDELQVGLADDLAIVLPDLPEIRALLAGLQEGRPPGPHATLPPTVLLACERLLARDLVVDGDVWCRQLGSTGPETDQARTATVAEHGLAAAEVLRRRTATRVAVDAVGAPRAAARIDGLLTMTGLEVGPARAAGTTDGSDLVVVLRRGEPDRADLDPLLRQDQPHVLLTVSEGRVQLGPFVQPGVTACVRCIDAHRHDADPRRSLVAQQYSDAGPAGTCGLPAPVPPDLLDIAVGMLARDVTRWSDGEQPSTWSSTIDVDPALRLSRTLWRRHPGCGCSWAGTVAS
jgi:bacteriocin biosynthesis cyclodehydratase domain-containing protein